MYRHETNIKTITYVNILKKNTYFFFNNPYFRTEKCIHPGHNTFDNNA